MARTEVRPKVFWCPEAVRKPLNMSASLKSLANDGFLLLNEPSSTPGNPTTIVIGVGRGGTTMVASVLEALGVHMGDRLSAVKEDLQVVQPMEAGDLGLLRERIRERNQTFQQWGFKRPGAVHYIRRFESEFREPQYVVIFRDVFAIANRNRLSMARELLPSLQEAHAINGQLIEFIGNTSARVLIASYEKAMLLPDEFVRAMAGFVGVDDEARIENARGVIQISPPDYLEQSRVGRSQGMIDKMLPRRIEGWARINGSDAPVSVRIRVNGVRVAEIKADQFRPKLKASGHPTVLCGFSVDLAQDLSLGDIVEARVVGDFRDLRNSPAVFGPKLVKATPEQFKAMRRQRRELMQTEKGKRQARSRKGAALDALDVSSSGPAANHDNSEGLHQSGADGAGKPVRSGKHRK